MVQTPQFSKVYFNRPPGHHHHFSWGPTPTRITAVPPAFRLRPLDPPPRLRASLSASGTVPFIFSGLEHLAVQFAASQRDEHAITWRGFRGIPHHPGSLRVPAHRVA